MTPDAVAAVEPLAESRWTRLRDDALPIRRLSAARRRLNAACHIRPAGFRSNLLLASRPSAAASAVAAAPLVVETRSTAQARDEFADLVNAVAYRGERVVLTRRGKAIAALVPVEDLEALEAAEDVADVAAADAARHEAPILWADAKAELGL